MIIHSLEQVQPHRPKLPKSRHAHKEFSNHSVLEANPYPEVTDLFCRLPWPTFFHWAIGYQPRRPDAVIGTIYDRIMTLGFSWAHHSDPDKHKNSLILLQFSLIADLLNSKGELKIKGKENSLRRGGGLAEISFISKFKSILKEY